MTSISRIKAYLGEYPWSLRLVRADWKTHGDQLKAIERACFDERMRSDPADLQGLITDPQVHALVLFDGKKAIGYIAGTLLEGASSSYDPQTDPPDGWGEHNTFYVDNVSILPEHRGTPAFKYLVMEAMRWLFSQPGYTQATAHARRSNGLSAYCVRKLHFKRLATIRNWYDCGEDFDYILFCKGQETSATPPAWARVLLDQLRYWLRSTPVEHYIRGKSGRSAANPDARSRSG